MKKTGSCLCKAVTVTTEMTETNFGVCHCGMCRKWGGGPLFASGMGQNTKFTGEEFVGVYSSSEWAERGFCKRCGTHLFYRMKNGGFMNFPLGLLDGTEGFKFNTEIYVDAKPGNYEFANNTNKMTEAQVLEKFAPPSQ
jgi:hypothetical protein